MKIEDLTLKQIKEICKKHRYRRVCDECPIWVECSIFFRGECPCKWYNEGLKREVEE